jgi:chromosome segregation ATPase
LFVSFQLHSYKRHIGELEDELNNLRSAFNQVNANSAVTIDEYNRQLKSQQSRMGELESEIERVRNTLNLQHRELEQIARERNSVTPTSCGLVDGDDIANIR